MIIITQCYHVDNDIQKLILLKLMFWNITQHTWLLSDTATYLYSDNSVMQKKQI